MIQGGGGAGILGEDLGCREGGLSRGWDGPLPGWALVWLELELGGPRCWGGTHESSPCTELRNQGLGPQLTQGQRMCGVWNQEARANTLITMEME